MDSNLEAITQYCPGKVLPFRANPAVTVLAFDIFETVFVYTRWLLVELVIIVRADLLNALGDA